MTDGHGGRAESLPRLDDYDALLFDLDGTLYRGGAAFPDAVALLAKLSQRVAFVTNNAARSAVEVAKHLTDLGYRAAPDDVVTSAQAAGRLVAEHVERGSAVLVVGTDALAAEVAANGLRPVRSAAEHPAAVVQGYSPTTDWPILAEAAYAIEAGAIWVAANTDTTLPTERGLAPGNGALVAALRATTGAEPVVAGKPHPPLLREAIARVGSDRVLVIGDRLDTDIDGANRLGLDSLLVLTGVSTADELREAPARCRPTYVVHTLAALDGDAGRCG
jgi:HAD superfamily hydrolase (TIGR01450 family)